MGQKYSTTTANWTMDDWAFGTGENAVQLDEVIEEAKIVPMKYFGGQVIGNDPSMQQMQRDLLSFDDTLKQIFFRRKKNKQSKTQNYYDQNQQSIPEVDEDQLSSNYTDNNQQPRKKNSSWYCRYCETKNKSKVSVCRRCKEIETRF